MKTQGKALKTEGKGSENTRKGTDARRADQLVEHDDRGQQCGQLGAEVREALGDRLGQPERHSCSTGAPARVYFLARECCL